MTRKDINGEMDAIKASPTLQIPEAVETSPHTPISKTEKEKNEEARMLLSFMTFCITHLIFHVAIMLSDGLQGESTFFQTSLCKYYVTVKENNINFSAALIYCTTGTHFYVLYKGYV